MYVQIFYKKCWDIVSPSVINCVLDSLNTCTMPRGMNETYIFLIPKFKIP